ncbi:hypothetical protein SKAU_G00273650 [Synaphobranchus kaupii]|uniref:G-protein coupled receptors family 1 profile domain-containing protein n=1 Tax=Synaphobranchus kaupii TaxID=118154 RepID=A0A9Q1F135_SYNKA|nr:hypothetical protein SKAU_G00273650 [Synaphobranchus kaupii]
MGSPSSPISVGLGSLDTGQLSVLVIWQGNTSIGLNQSHNQSQRDSGETMKEKNWPALLILVIILLTIGGNILVILAVSLEKKLQNATNFFLRSLAVADILVGILVMPISLINILYDYAWPLPNALCPIWIYLDVLFSTASIMHLCAISLDRYVAIRNPIEHSRFNSRTKAMMKIAAVWTISIVISMPIPVIGLLNEEKVFVNGSCVLNEERFMLVGSFVAFFIPLIIMVVTYCLTVQVLRRQASDLLYESKASQQHPQPVPTPQTQHRHSSLSCLKLEPSLSTTPASSLSVIPGSEAPSQFSSPGGRDMGGHGRRGMMQAIKNERRASKVLGVVFFLFLVMWCPFFITNVMYVLCRGACNEPLLGELLNVFVWVGYISSGVNPLVYTLFNKTYRRAFSNYMRCHYPGAGLKPHAAHTPCPSYAVTPTLLRGKESVDNNSNCRNGEGSPLGDPEEHDTGDGPELRLGKVSLNSCHAPAEHTSCM